MSNSDLLLENDLTEELFKKYSQQSAIAVDTETMGLNPHRDRLCLVQLYGGEELGHIIRINQKSASNLKILMEETKIIKVFHYARFDLMFLQKYLGIHVQNIYCTKIASKLARTYAPKHGLKDLVSDLAGVELDKSSQSTNWSQAELSENQIKYALNDVRYLIPIMKKLNQMLMQEERQTLLDDCLKVLPTLVQLELMGWSESIFSHH